LNTIEKKSPAKEGRALEGWERMPYLARTIFRHAGVLCKCEDALAVTRDAPAVTGALRTEFFNKSKSWLRRFVLPRARAAKNVVARAFAMAHTANRKKAVSQHAVKFIIGRV
jgi:hypothetical protein